MWLNIKQTPSLVRASSEVDFVLSMETISPKILSPNLRHSSPTVRAAVWTLHELKLE